MPNRSEYRAEGINFGSLTFTVSKRFESKLIKYSA